MEAGGAGGLRGWKKPSRPAPVLSSSKRRPQSWSGDSRHQNEPLKAESWGRGGGGWREGNNRCEQGRREHPHLDLKEGSIPLYPGAKSPRQGRLGLPRSPGNQALGIRFSLHSAPPRSQLLRKAWVTERGIDLVSRTENKRHVAGPPRSLILYHPFPKYPYFPNPKSTYAGWSVWDVFRAAEYNI